MENPDRLYVARGIDVVQHGRHHAARTARRRRHHHAARGILLGSGQRIGIQPRPTAERLVVALGLHHVGAGFSAHLQPAGQHPFVVQAALDGIAHRLPYRGEVFPQPIVLVILNILPEGFALLLAPPQNILDRGQRIDVGRFGLAGRFVGQRSAAHAVDRPVLRDPVAAEGLEPHAVRMERQHDLRLPHDLGRRSRFQHRQDRRIGQVALAGCRQRTVQGHPETVGIAMAGQKLLRRFLGPYGMAARGAVAYSE